MTAVAITCAGTVERMGELHSNVAGGVAFTVELAIMSTVRAIVTVLAPLLIVTAVLYALSIWF